MAEMGVLSRRLGPTTSTPGGAKPRGSRQQRRKSKREKEELPQGRRGCGSGSHRAPSGGNRSCDPEHQVPASGFLSPTTAGILTSSERVCLQRPAGKLPQPQTLVCGAGGISVHGWFFGNSSQSHLAILPLPSTKPKSGEREISANAPNCPKC